MKKGIRKKTDEEVAIKIFKRYFLYASIRATLGEDDEVALRNEVDILSQVNIGQAKGAVD